ncbi:DUF1365 domain-containing protein [Frigidibacter sp. MR17.24]|uniref:DUF1365 domain-containing protein n=1 Tax=Frigidibacter sp. MR17.24 TaxID=3127345 RepID=UPI0030130920
MTGAATNRVEHIAGATCHVRRGAVAHAFRHGFDYVHIPDMEAPVAAPWPFSRRGGVLGLRDRDHGGAPGQGRGAAWLREVLAAEGIAVPGLRIGLIAQPRVLGHVFNPVAFWLARDGAGRLRAVVAEVSNTFGDRHSYLCVRPDLAPITRDDRIGARKVFHVSPFQDIAGGYTFRFDLEGGRVGIFIDYRAGADGLYASFAGTRRALTRAGIAAAMLRRPLGARRVWGLIHWQALRLWLKGVRYRPRPQPPAAEVTR